MTSVIQTNLLRYITYSSIPFNSQEMPVKDPKTSTVTNLPEIQLPKQSNPGSGKLFPPHCPQESYSK